MLPALGSAPERGVVTEVERSGVEPDGRGSQVASRLPTRPTSTVVPEKAAARALGSLLRPFHLGNPLYLPVFSGSKKVATSTVFAIDGVV